METAVNLAEWNRRFQIVGVAQIIEGKGGLPKVQITTRGVSAEIYIHGAHVTSWKPPGEEEVLFVSSKTRRQDGAAIRGGIPISFPWFADRTEDPHSPVHGFVRTKSWQLDSITQQGGAVIVTMSTSSDESTRKWWAADFRLVYRATFGPELRLELAVKNLGPHPIRFEEALHTYYRVGQVQQARVRGLDSVRFIDKTDAKREKPQQGEVIIAAETDRVYLNTRKEVELVDPLLQRRIVIAKNNSISTVVWNPWAEKAKAMPDMGENEWAKMLCVETANVGDAAIELAPDQEHAMGVAVSVKRL
jgi:D-hexose-6-phosphate mutarotase